MLYKLSQDSGAFDGLEPMPFNTMTDFDQVEKDLENLLAGSLLDALFEEDRLMPIFQERSRQSEADIYALDAEGNVVIFELKRDTAYDGAAHQVLRYCETAAQWKYRDLNEMYHKYATDTATDLAEAHRGNFDLETPLRQSDFNRNQRLVVIGSAGSDALRRNVAYWRSRGIDIDFIPYRIYEIGGEHYFEFFSKPYDSHANPAYRKGVLFDTNSTWREDSIWYMCENNRVAAFGGQMHIVEYLSPNDTVFLYHKGWGIVAAGRVTGKPKADLDEEAMYCDLEWLTDVPKRNGDLRAMYAGAIKEALGHGFFWARTIKVPYLSPDEAEKLVNALSDHLGQA